MGEKIWRCILRRNQIKHFLLTRTLQLNSRKSTSIEITRIYQSKMRNFSLVMFYSIILSPNHYVSVVTETSDQWLVCLAMMGTDRCICLLGSQSTQVLCQDNSTRKKYRLFQIWILFNKQTHSKHLVLNIHFRKT